MKWFLNNAFIIVATANGTDHFDFDAFKGQLANIFRFSNIAVIVFWMPISVSSDNLKRTQERNGNLLLFKSVNPTLDIFSVLYQSGWVSLGCFLEIQVDIYSQFDILNFYLDMMSGNLFLGFLNLVISHLHESLKVGLYFSSLCRLLKFTNCLIYEIFIKFGILVLYDSCLKGVK